MNTNIPFAHSRVLQLPLFSATGDEFDEFDSAETLIDHHSYFSQLKFLPSPFNNSNNFNKLPPLEFWLEIDEFEKASIETLKVLKVQSEMNSLVTLPSYPTDLKFIKCDSEVLIQPSDGSENWLSSQPGVKTFLERANFDFSGRSKVCIPDFVEVNMPGFEHPIRYEYVSLSYRRHLDLNYNGRQLQYATIEGGQLGGRTSEILIVGKDKEMSKPEFESFVHDAVEFVKSLS